MNRIPFLFAMATSGALLSACDPDIDGNPCAWMPDSCPPPFPSGWVETMPYTTSLPCMGQRAFVPRRGTVSETATSSSAESSRREGAVYVSYQVQTKDLFAYFSFNPGLPRTGISTDIARTMLKYAYVNFAMKQPADVGGTLTLLSGNDLLHLEDFERFEVGDGQLKWRLVRRSAERYAKKLSIYDEDASNDPNPRDACTTGDIEGMCYCEFTGPAIAVTIDGTTTL